MVYMQTLDVKCGMESSFNGGSWQTSHGKHCQDDLLETSTKNKNHSKQMILAMGWVAFDTYEWAIAC